jgi:hypothetical protein
MAPWRANLEGIPTAAPSNLRLQQMCGRDSLALPFVIRNNPTDRCAACRIDYSILGILTVYGKA